MNWKFFDTPLFTLYGKEYGAVDIALVIVIIFVGLWLSKSFKKFMNSAKMQSTIENNSTRSILGNFGKYLIILITFFITIDTLGIDLSSLTVVAGALSVGIGFGLQNIVNNLVSGIILMGEGSVKIGDIVELDSTTIGKVEEVRLRSTLVRTFDNVEIVVPNSEFVQNRIVNRTLSSPVRRLVMSFGVAYGTEVDTVKSVILNAVEGSGLHFIKDEDKKPVVRMMAMGASSVDFNLYLFIDQSRSDAPLPSDYLVVIYNALNKANIAIPFPQLDVHIVKEG